MPVASRATVSMRQSLSHWAISPKSGVLVPKRRTDALSRSAGTQTKSSRAPISMPQALGLIFSQFSSRAIFLNFFFLGFECLFFMFLGLQPENERRTHSSKRDSSTRHKRVELHQ